MRLIWFLDPTLPIAPKERVRRAKEELARRAAWRLRRRVLYWAVVRAAVTVVPDGDPSGVTVTQMLDAIGND